MRLILKFMLQWILFVSVSEAATFEKTDIVNFPLGGNIEFNYSVIDKTLKSPVAWKINIKVNGKTALMKLESEDNLDNYYSNPEFQEGCNDLQSCKNNWYFTELPAQIISSLNMVSGKEKLEQWEIEVLNSTAINYLTSLGYSKKIIERTVTEIKGLLLTDHVSLNPPLWPEQNDAVYVYVPSLNLFVPYFDD